MQSLFLCKTGFWGSFVKKSSRNASPWIFLQVFVGIRRFLYGSFTDGRTFARVAHGKFRLHAFFRDSRLQIWWEFTFLQALLQDTHIDLVEAFLCLW